MRERSEAHEYRGRGGCLALWRQPNLARWVDKMTAMAITDGNVAIPAAPTSIAIDAQQFHTSIDGRRAGPLFTAEINSRAHHFIRRIL